MDIPFLSYLPSDVTLIRDAYNFVVDAIFGTGYAKLGDVSFVRKCILRLSCFLDLTSLQRQISRRFSARFTLRHFLLSVSTFHPVSHENEGSSFIKSKYCFYSKYFAFLTGWDVDGGSTAVDSIQPEVLISIAVPKLCARTFRGRHLVAGRFLPPDLVKKFDLHLAPFNDYDWTCEVSITTSPNSSGSDDRIDQSASNRKLDDVSDNSH